MLFVAERPVETHDDKIRSVVAQVEYSHQVRKASVPYLYVPEVHPISGMELHEREDDAHVLKIVYS